MYIINRNRNIQTTQKRVSLFWPWSDPKFERPTRWGPNGRNGRGIYETRILGPIFYWLFTGSPHFCGHWVYPPHDHCVTRLLPGHTVVIELAHSTVSTRTHVTSVVVLILSWSFNQRTSVAWCTLCEYTFGLLTSFSKGVISTTWFLIPSKLKKPAADCGTTWCRSVLNVAKLQKWPPLLVFGISGFIKKLAARRSFACVNKRKPQ